MNDGEPTNEEVVRNWKEGIARLRAALPSPVVSGPADEALKLLKQLPPDELEKLFKELGYEQKGTCNDSK